MLNFMEIVFCGDLVLDEPNPEYWLSGIAPALQSADLAVGHLEVPHTKSTLELKGDVPAPGADPNHLDALPEAGFRALTLAGNHMSDCGERGITDTREGLNRLGLACCGAGIDLKEARRPALLSISAKVISVLSYNCVGPLDKVVREIDPNAIIFHVPGCPPKPEAIILGVVKALQSL